MQYLARPLVSSRPPFFSPFIFGAVTSPLMAAIIKPLLRSTVKAAVGVALQARKIAAEAREEFQDLAAEAGAEIAAAETQQYDKRQT